MAPGSPDAPHPDSSLMASTRLSQLQNHLSPVNLVLTSYSPDRQVVTLKINNAARANCLSTAVLQTLLSALTAINPGINIDSSIDTEDPISFAERVCRSHTTPIPKVVVLKSAGNIFCSGHDLRELHAAETCEAMHNIFRLCTTVMLTIRRLPQIVISQVHQMIAKVNIGPRNCDGGGISISGAGRPMRCFS